MTLLLIELVPGVRVYNVVPATEDAPMGLVPELWQEYSTAVVTVRHDGNYGFVYNGRAYIVDPDEVQVIE